MRCKKCKISIAGNMIYKLLTLCVILMKFQHDVTYIS